MASVIVVAPSSDTVELAGAVESVSKPLIAAHGIAVNPSDIPSDRFRGVGGKSASPREFFGVVKPGVIVAVERTLQRGAVNRMEIMPESAR